MKKQINNKKINKISHSYLKISDTKSNQTPHNIFQIKYTTPTRYGTRISLCQMFKNYSKIMNSHKINLLILFMV